MKVYLSPSDQWSNMVADGEHSEAYHCKQIADSAKKYLEVNGYDVKVGDNSKEGSYVNRVTESNNWGADLHVPIHTNAGGGVGTLMLAYSSSVSNKYVTNIYNEVANLTPSKDRGIQSRSNLYEINSTKCVCAYIEVEFHDNATTENWIDVNIDNIGKAIARGICKADGKTFKESASPQKPNTSSNKLLYKVQAGAYRQESGAKATVASLQKAGFDSFCYLDTDCDLYKVQVGAFSEKENAEKRVKDLKAKGFNAFAYKSV